MTSSYTYDPDPQSLAGSSGSGSGSGNEDVGRGPLMGLSPGMASLHGSLRCMGEEWIKELPPDRTVKARFGNPVFKTWHDRLTGGDAASDHNYGTGTGTGTGTGGRSRRIVLTMMKCHLDYTVPMLANNEGAETGDTSTPSTTNTHSWDISAPKRDTGPHLLLLLLPTILTSSLQIKNPTLPPYNTTKSSTNYNPTSTYPSDTRYE